MDLTEYTLQYSHNFGVTCAFFNRYWHNTENTQLRQYSIKCNL